jgi:hypothetical protein
MVVSKEKRRKRRRLRALQNESAWLQKALFALWKAEAANEKAADAVDQDADEYALTVDGADMPLEVFEDALQKRADVLLATTREMRQALV